MTSVSETWFLRCPKCADDKEIHIAAETIVRLHPDGTEEVGNGCEWARDSVCFCNACGFEGRVREFEDQ